MAILFHETGFESLPLMNTVQSLLGDTRVNWCLKGGDCVYLLLSGNRCLNGWTRKVFNSTLVMYVKWECKGWQCSVGSANCSESGTDEERWNNARRVLDQERRGRLRTISAVYRFPACVARASCSVHIGVCWHPHRTQHREFQGSASRFCTGRGRGRHAPVCERGRWPCWYPQALREDLVRRHIQKHSLKLQSGFQVRVVVETSALGVH